MKFTIYQDSRQGPRQYNQDRVAYSYSKDALLTVLADGMGGHRNGEVAAQFAIEVLTESFQRMARPKLSNPFKFLDDHIRQVHDAIDRHALLSDMPEPPRTTIVTALVQHDALYCAHAGDSRLYHFRGGELLFRTEDHSKVQMLYRKGMIGKDEMLTHPERNKIYNCVGGAEQPQIEMSPKRDVQDGDIVLLCTDGLWTLLADEEIAATLQNGPITDTVPALFDLAESRADQSGDNMSAIAFSWGNHAYSGFSVSTAMMPLDLNTTIRDFTSRRAGANPDLATDSAQDDEIERAIAEIHAALEKIPR
ncbi:phosphatase [Methylobacillus sp. MM3]|uniref:PP2C family protein-serine/threonine phosphatase n=1 Tax=Methylobacillus sp. MM3 TaxID=1848039 RepID=UPI0007DFBD39|nr:protein phosphatase 2C domain-containing protein [Methylobacillus sp. MM3]OAJ70468.1 phosphatase [Methylobacillus sp. MM3]